MDEKILEAMRVLHDYCEAEVAACDRCAIRDKLGCIYQIGQADTPCCWKVEEV